MTEKIAYIGLGSNLGDRQDFISHALQLLSEAEKVRFVRASDIIETKPLAQANQPNYLNTVAEIKTELTAEQLLDSLLKIETMLGRIHRQKWSSRNIDLDLLLFGDEIIGQPDLVVPHPQLHLRSFVLKGLCRLNPDLYHPVLREPLHVLYERLTGADFIIDSRRPQLVSIAGVIGVGKTFLTKVLSQYLECKILLEPYNENPFLPAVYAGKKELALDSQLYFLAGRISQLNHDVLRPGQIALSDYVFDKEQLYARLLLDAEQLALYKTIYCCLSREVIPPVLVIYLHDSSQNCLGRIRKRNRPYEQKIEQTFLEVLNCAYEELFAQWRLCPVIRLPMSEFDCEQDSDIDHLANQVRFYVAEKTPSETGG